MASPKITEVYESAALESSGQPEPRIDELAARRLRKAETAVGKLAMDPWGYGEIYAEFMAQGAAVVHEDIGPEDAHMGGSRVAYGLSSPDYLQR